MFFKTILLLAKTYTGANPTIICFQILVVKKILLKKIWRHPYLNKMTIWGTLSSKRAKKGSKFNIWWHPDTSSRHPGLEPLF